MNTTTISPTTTPSRSHRASPLRRIVSVVAEPQSYRNIAYLLLGLPLGTIWFSVLVSGLATAVSMIVVALVGIPMLWGMWFLVRWLANVERSTANVLLSQRLHRAPMAAPARGNVWARFRSMTNERDRWRELGFLLLRFPAGLATFTAAVTAFATPFLVAYAPFSARYGGDHPFGTWSQSSRIEDIANSSWAWFLVPVGVGMVFASFHFMNAVARACGRWTTTWLGGETTSAP